MKDLIVYASSQDPEDRKNTEGYRASYFYLHGYFDEINGYDICTMSPELLTYCLWHGVKVCKCKINGKLYEALVFSNFEMDRMQGYVVSISHFEDIKDAIKKFKTIHMYAHDEKYVKETYPNTWEFMKRTYRELF